MKQKFSFLTLILFFSLVTFSQTKKNGAPDMRYKANKENYSNANSSSVQTQKNTYQTTTVRPVYDGQTHTESHGGSYPGSINSHHKDGHYVSPSYQPVYGIHKTKKR